MAWGLALETSGRLGSIALVRDGAVVATADVPTGFRHAAALLPTINDLCRSHAVTPRELVEIYLDIGPGSFTGLRVGVTLVKTMAWTTGARVVTVVSPRVLVENAPSEAREVVTLLDAKRGQVFTARYLRDNANVPWREVEPPKVDTLAAMLARASGPVWLMGDGLPLHRQFISANADVVETPEALWRCRAETVAALGVVAARADAFVDPMTLQPLYIRLAEAEEKRLMAGT